MIVVDTSIIGKCASDASSAEQGIDEALDELKKIKNHLTWHCSEKKQINQKINSCESDLKKLRKSASRFSDAIADVNTMFIEAESTAKNGVKKGLLSNLLGKIRSIVTNIFNNKIVKTVGTAVPAVAPIMLVNNLLTWIKSKTVGKSKYSAFSTVSIQDALSICNFPDSSELGGR